MRAGKQVCSCSAAISVSASGIGIAAQMFWSVNSHQIPIKYFMICSGERQDSRHAIFQLFLFVHPGTPYTALKCSESNSQMPKASHVLCIVVNN